MFKVNNIAGIPFIPGPILLPGSRSVASLLSGALRMVGNGSTALAAKLVTRRQERHPADVRIERPSGNIDGSDCSGQRTPAERLLSAKVLIDRYAALTGTGAVASDVLLAAWNGGSVCRQRSADALHQVMEMVPWNTATRHELEVLLQDMTAEGENAAGGDDLCAAQFEDYFVKSLLMLPDASLEICGALITKSVETYLAQLGQAGRKPLRVRLAEFIGADLKRWEVIGLRSEALRFSKHPTADSLRKLLDARREGHVASRVLVKHAFDLAVSGSLQLPPVRYGWHDFPEHGVEVMLQNIALIEAALEQGSGSASLVAAFSRRIPGRVTSLGDLRDFSHATRLGAEHAFGELAQARMRHASEGALRRPPEWGA